MIRAAWINLETGIVENIILVDESDLSNPAIKQIPSMINDQGVELFLPISILESKWVEGVGFTNLNGIPIDYSSYPPAPIRNPE